MGRFFRVIRALVRDPAMPRVTVARLLVSLLTAQLIGRVFGIVDGLSMAGLTAGALLTPLLVGLGGVRLALIAVGGLLPVTALCGLRTLRRLDRAVPVTEVALLHSLPHFADLPGPALGTLAGAPERVDVTPGQVLIRQGDDGDRFYAIADGEMAVWTGGRGGRGRGTGLGKIALLRRTPRTATVTAVTPATLFALDCDTFLAADSGHAPTRRRAYLVAARWASADASTERTWPQRPVLGE